MSTCSNQYDCDAKNIHGFVQQLAQSLLNILIRPRDQRRWMRRIRSYLTAIGWYDYVNWKHSYWFSLVVFVLAQIVILPIVFKQIFKWFQPEIDVEQDSAPFEEPLEPEHHYDRCTICLNRFNTKRRIAFLSGCVHLYHRRCIEEWFKESSGCPQCRKVSHYYYVHSRVIRNPIVRQMVCNHAKYRCVPKQAKPDPPNIEAIMMEILRYIRETRLRELERQEEEEEESDDDNAIEFELEEDEEEEEKDDNEEFGDETNDLYDLDDD